MYYLFTKYVAEPLRLRERLSVQRERRSNGASPLSMRLAAQILDDVRGRGGRVGDHLTEQQFVRQFRVSRSPVRQALQFLARKRILTFQPNRGFFLARSASEIRDVTIRPTSTIEEEIYYRIAEDRVRGALPEQFSESDFIARYRISRIRLAKVLIRMAEEGWVEHLPGHGWCFLPTLDSLEALDHSLRFRMVIEPAAILEPTFRMDKPVFDRIRTEHRPALEHRLEELSPFEVYRLGSRFHETILRCSGNRFYLEAFQRIDRLRRLMEYRTYRTDPQRPDRYREHLEMLDLIEAGDRQEAARVLRAHLDSARRVKTDAPPQASPVLPRGEVTPATRNTPLGQFSTTCPVTTPDTRISQRRSR